MYLTILHYSILTYDFVFILKAVWRKMVKLSYLHHVNTNENACKTVKLLLTLPLLPARDMERGFLLICAFARNHGVHLERLLRYYERYLFSLKLKNITSYDNYL